MTLSRRDILLGGAGLAAATLTPALRGDPAFAQGQAPTFKPEPGATLRLRGSTHIRIDRAATNMKACGLPVD